jgi:hypothetical protein
MADSLPEIIRAYIINPELNNYEIRSGLWHAFPTTKADLQKSFAKIRLDGIIHSKYIINPYDSFIEGLSSVVPKEASFDELNYLAVRIGEMGEESQSVFSAAMQTGEFSTMRDIINVTGNTNCFYLQPAFSPEIFGDFLLNNYREYFLDNIEALKNSRDEGRREFADYIETLEACVDKKALGRHKAEAEQGHFTTKGYLTRTAAEFVEIYNTPTDIPDDYRVFAYPDAAHMHEAIECGKKRPGSVICTNGEIKPGDLVLSLPDNDYAYLVGKVVGIDRIGSARHETGNATDDIYVDFTTMDYSEHRVNEIEAMFSELYGAPKRFAECPMDNVIMAPGNLLKITGIPVEKLIDILDSVDKAAAFCEEVAEENASWMDYDEKIRASRSSLVETLIKNKQLAKSQPPATKCGSELDL